MYSVSSNDKLLDDKALLKQYRNTITVWKLMPTHSQLICFAFHVIAFLSTSWLQKSNIRYSLQELRARIEELSATGGTLTEPRSFRSDSVLLTRSGSIATSNLETDPALIYSQGG